MSSRRHQAEPPLRLPPRELRELLVFAFYAGGFAAFCLAVGWLAFAPPVGNLPPP